MKEQPQIKGWCPTGWRPMASGDGWILRVQQTEYSSAQLLSLCALAEQWGSGVVELTNRGNLQLRGLAQHAIASVQSALVDLGCLPPADAPISVLLNPDWQAGDLTDQLAQAWQRQPHAWQDLPAKFSLIVDAGAQPLLSAVHADIRIECSATGQLLVRLDGHDLGAECASVEGAIAHVNACIEWFVAQRSPSVHRMRDLVALPQWHQPDTAPAATRSALLPGPSTTGWVLGVPFGQVMAQSLAEALATGPATAVRLTPWRSFLMRDWQAWPELDPKPWICSPDDPRRRVVACPGAPYCSQASVRTRELALALAPEVSGTLHVSGCAKQCASRQAHDITLIGRSGRYDLIQADGIEMQGLSAELLRQQLRRQKCPTPM